MKPGGNRPPGDNPLLFSISGTGSFICPVAQAQLDIPRPLITQSQSTGGKAENCLVGNERKMKQENEKDSTFFFDNLGFPMHQAAPKDSVSPSMQINLGNLFFF